MTQTSIREVAARAGVSVGTVSNVLNRPARVSAKMRVRVQAAIEELGFVRNETARQLRVGRSRTLGLVLPDTIDPFFADVARGVEETSAEAGLAVIVCSSGQAAEREERALELLERQQVGGLLITPVAAGPERVAALRRSGMGVVLVDRRPRRADECSVRVDYLAGGEMAVRHLLGQGHRRIAYVTTPLDVEPNRDRHRGALRALRAAGLSEDVVVPIIEPRPTPSFGARAASRLLSMEPRPTAVFCSSDLLAIGLLNRLLRSKVKVPQDIAIVGSDDIELAACAALPLTTVAQPRAELGQAAAELALSEADDTGSHQHRHLVLPPELIIRETSVTL